MEAVATKPPEKVTGENGRKGEAEGQTRKTYAGAVRGKEAPYEKMKLRFMEPKKQEGKPVVEIPEAMVKKGQERWQNTVIGYVLGPNPSFREMTQFVNSVWAPMGRVQVHGMGNGIYVFQMESEDAKMEVLEKGPWSFMRRALILRPWSPGMNVDKPSVDQIPVWIRYPKLPLDLWTDDGLSLISSHIGNPLFADRTTTTQSNLAYARVCVEVKAETELLTELPVKYEGGHTFVQQVIYEWVPDKCKICCKFGHKSGNCTSVMTKKYVPKPQEKQEKQKAKIEEKGEGSSSVIETPRTMALTPFASQDQRRAMITPQSAVAKDTNKFSPLIEVEEEGTEGEDEQMEQENVEEYGQEMINLIAKMVASGGKTGRKKGKKKGGRRRLEVNTPEGQAGHT